MKIRSKSNELKEAILSAYKRQKVNNYESNNVLKGFNRRTKEAGNSLPAQIERIDNYCKINLLRLLNLLVLMKVLTRKKG